MFPSNRYRRLRKNESIRSLIRETHLSVNDFVLPIFVTEGKGIEEPIHSMPGVYRRSLDLTVKEIKELWSLGIKAINLYVKVPQHLKDNTGKEAWNPDGLMQNAIKTIKEACPEILIMSDVALDPYSIFGHDGIVENAEIINDATVDALVRTSLSHAEAGVDFVAPSDMMDGRIGAIRDAFEDNGYDNVGIVSYAAKYASSFYGPFRDALDSAPVDKQEIPKDKKTYQMDFHNTQEALREVEEDIMEGADIIMVKPGIAYLDIVSKVKSQYNVPVAAFQVSGEYAMIKAASANGWLEHDKVMIESLTSFKRAGADMIFTYFAKEAAQLLNK